MITRPTGRGAHLYRERLASELWPLLPDHHEGLHRVPDGSASLPAGSTCDRLAP